MLRLHGELGSIPGLARLQRHCRELSGHLIIVSGTGERRADFTEAGTVPLDVLDAVTAYLMQGGERNVAECVSCSPTV